MSDRHRIILLIKEIEKMFKTTLKIDGMMCPMCESHINGTVRNHFKVKKVSSSHSKGTTEIISDEQPDENTLCEEIYKTGYKVLDVKTEPYEKKGFSLFRKKGRS